MRWSMVLLWATAWTTAAASQAELSTLLDEVVPDRLQAMDIPGAAVAVVRRGKPVLLVGFGTTDPGTREPVDPARHVFRVGSVSKALTATVVLRVFQARNLNLHGDLRPYLAELSVRPSPEQSITMHQLLTHTAGFNEQLFGQHTFDPSRFRHLGDYLKEQLPPRFIEPGRVIAYNDHHSALAGWIAGEITGTPFPLLAERQLFGPLAMSATTFRQIGQPDRIAENRVPAWHRRGGVLRAYPRGLIQTTPAAGAWSTAADMARYLSALLDCGSSGLEPVGRRRQLQRQAAHHELLPGRAYGFAEGTHGALRVLFKDGQASGFNARLLLVPEQGLGIFVVHNRNILGRFGAFLPAARFNREITTTVLGALHPVAERSLTKPEPAPDAGERSATYAGDYRNVVAARHSWERFIGMFDDVHVEATSEGVDFGFGEYVEVEPGLLQWHEGGDSYRVFQREHGRGSHLFIGSGAYERIPWYVASWFTPWLVLGLSAWFLVSMVPVLAGGSGWHRLVGALPGLTFLGFLLGFGLMLAFTDVQAFFRGPTVTLLILLVLPIVGGVALLAQALGLVAGQPRALWRRGVVLVNLASGGSFLAWLEYWNLLGYRLG